MDEKIIKEKITRAVNEPSPPARLVETTVRRAQLIVAGRRAEAELKTASPEARAGLLADSVLGRLALSDRKVAELSGDPRTQLMESERFQSLTGRDPAELLRGLKNGSLVRELGTDPIAAPQQEQQAPTLEQPVLETPRRTRESHLPGL